MRPKAARHPIAERLAPLLLALLMASCGGSFRQDAGSQPHLFGPWQRVAPERLGLDFEGAKPEIVAAREREAADGVHVFEAVLANETFDYGENKVLLAVRDQRDNRPLALDTELVTFDFTPAVIERNFALLLKGARRTAEPAARRNRYGTYYYLAAEYPGSSRCIYAWQILRPSATSFGRPQRDAMVQVRYCDPERAPEELVTMFDHIVLRL